LPVFLSNIGLKDFENIINNNAKIICYKYSSNNIDSTIFHNGTYYENALISRQDNINRIANMSIINLPIRFLQNDSSASKSVTGQTLPISHPLNTSNTEASYAVPVLSNNLATTSVSNVVTTEPQSDCPTVSSMIRYNMTNTTSYYPSSFNSVMPSGLQRTKTYKPTEVIDVINAGKDVNEHK
jgi:hypothetical protein